MHQIYRATNVRLETVAEVSRRSYRTTNICVYVPGIAQVKIDRPGVLE